MNSITNFSVFILLAIIFTGTKERTKHKTLIPGKQNIISCSVVDTQDFYTGENGKYIPVMPGWGNHFYKVNTTNDSAQFYFNQGLTMYYSYHAREAIASFKEAVRFDNNCTMAYWGQALAMGPGYNSSYGYHMGKNVPGVITQMDAAAAYASPKEKELIAVMQKRYNISDTSDSQRKQLNEAYAEGMKQLSLKYPSDNDIKALYIDAVMLIHAWNFWNPDGSAQPWTSELVTLCESILKNDPRHPGALHYHVHVTEASRHPQVALSSADSLKNLFPGVAHMIHMSSHEYERSGLYANGVDVNEKADADLVNYKSLASNVKLSAHAAHYFAVGAYCALSGGMYKEALSFAERCRTVLKPGYSNTGDQYLYMLPQITQVRLGRWQEIINSTDKPNDQWTYAVILYNFAKGMAYAHTGDITTAQQHLAMLREKETDTILKVRDYPFNTPYEAVVISENILSAHILFAEKKHKAAIKEIQKAISVEDKMIYAEPRDWMLPARQYLGAFLLQMNKPKQAEKVYREDQQYNPGTGWSLLGLYQSLVAQHKKNRSCNLPATIPCFFFRRCRNSTCISILTMQQSYL